MSAFFDSARAKKSISSGSEIRERAALRCCLYSETGKKVIDWKISSFLMLNSSSESFDFRRHSPLCSSNSSFINSGAMNLRFIEEKR